MFDELLSRVNKYVRVEADEMATFSMAGERIGSSGGNDNGKFDKSKRKIL